MAVSIGALPMNIPEMLSIDPLVLHNPYSWMLCRILSQFLSQTKNRQIHS